MRRIWATFYAVYLALLATAAVRGDDAPATGWLPALPGWIYAFPRDHAVHPDFKTEWWYFTGNLRDAAGRPYGYELTFFREGVLTPGRSAARATVPNATLSRFVQNDFKFAHFAVSDLQSGKFSYTQKTSRGAFGEAGFADGGTADPRLAWLDDWTLTAQPDGAWHLTARATKPAAMSIDLLLTSAKPPAIEGTDGISRKAAGVGNASHYYSFSRLQTTGTLAAAGETRPQPIQGESWFDHEWASNQLAADQVGWNWFCCQFDDHTELMLYAMRRRDGSIDSVSSGTLIDGHGATAYLKRAEVDLQPLKTWHSTRTNATYPIEWKIRIPGHALEITIRPRLEDQELALPEISYWEGATEITGLRAGHPITGVGYMELTGYTGALNGLQAAPR